MELLSLETSTKLESGLSYGLSYVWFELCVEHTDMFLKFIDRLLLLLLDIESNYVDFHLFIHRCSSAASSHCCFETGSGLYFISKPREANPNRNVCINHKQRTLRLSTPLSLQRYKRHWHQATISKTDKTNHSLINWIYLTLIIHSYFIPPQLAHIRLWNVWKISQQLSLVISCSKNILFWYCKHFRNTSTILSL